jgi:diguanylate cyclase (GGDEF)-like protein
VIQHVHGVLHACLPWKNADALHLQPARFGGLYRVAVYILLALLILSGVILSGDMTRTTRGMRDATVPLLREKVMTLEKLCQFETALLQHQLAMNKYFARSINRERFLALQQATQEDMANHVAFLRNNLSAGPALSELDGNYRRLMALAFHFKESTLPGTADQRAAKSALFDINLCVNKILNQLQGLRKQSEATLYLSENTTSARIHDMGNMVHLYSYGILLTGLFMLYHVWARFSSEDRLAFQANHDPLTGLAHRRSFEACLRRLALVPHTVVLGRLDRFERIVGGFGHEMGDLMIQQITLRIARVAEQYSGAVFRLDGANIAILYKKPTDESALQTALSELRDEMRRPLLLDHHEIFSSLSLGTAEYPLHGTEPVQLLKNADAALRAAHKAGGDCVIAYSHALNAKANERLLLETSLRQAVHRGELELHYQPQQNLASNRLVGFEALLRWRHKHIPVSPAEFIPLAEESSLIVELGNWVFEQACRQAKRWYEQSGCTLLIAVNISPRQFSHPDFLPFLRKTLQNSDVDPGHIELEITEGMVMENSERMIDLLQSLRALGLKLAIDDFGTGYSSLAYLTRFPVNRIKIDQSFIARLERGPADVSVVKAAVQLCHGLGMNVIAEGVETERQRECLRELGCDEIQGYCYSRPLSPAAAAEFLVHH